MHLELDLECVHRIQLESYEFMSRSGSNMLQNLKKYSKKQDNKSMQKKNIKKSIDLYNMTPVPVTQRRFAHQCREGLGPNILIDTYKCI